MPELIGNAPLEPGRELLNILIFTKNAPSYCTNTVYLDILLTLTCR